MLYYILLSLQAYTLGIYGHNVDIIARKHRQKTSTLSLTKQEGFVLSLHSKYELWAVAQPRLMSQFSIYIGEKDPTSVYTHHFRPVFLRWYSVLWCLACALLPWLLAATWLQRLTSPLSNYCWEEWLTVFYECFSLKIVTHAFINWTCIVSSRIEKASLFTNIYLMDVRNEM